jgi:hypothetical protein
MGLLTKKKRDEAGAYAILFALLATVLMGFAALAIDLGNAMSRKSDVQAQADFAALSAAGQLGAQTSGPIPSTVLDAVRLSINSNQPVNRGGQPCADPANRSCIADNAVLIDGNLLNGEVRWANGGLQVITPQDRVTYGIAGVLGTPEKRVLGRATVKIFSPLGAMPVYAVQPCDFGRQTITDPANGQVAPVSVPTLEFDAQTNATTLVSTDLGQIALNATGTTIGLTGKGWNTTVKVGFFPADGGAHVEASTFKDDANVDHPNAPAAPVPYSTSGQSAHVVRFPVPTGVSTVEKVWYIRVWNAASGNWSAKSQAIPLRVGEPVLECDAGSSDGNFGAVKFPRTDVSSQNDQLAMNMATNIQAPMTLTVHTSWTSPGTCTNGQNGAVTSALPNPGLQPGTNCLDTDTGLPALAATAGMIKGVGSTPGRLTTKATKSGCSPNGGSNNRTVTIQGTYSINDDVLSCYLTGGASLATIASSSYNGDAVLDQSIYDSPRFFFVPVLHVEPGNGGSQRYSIVDFRPAFLTDEVVAGSSVNGSHTATADNGVTIEQNQIKTMKVIFFNSHALPDRTGGAVTAYFGVGPKIIRMID